VAARERYGWLFALSIAVLAVGAVWSFQKMGMGNGGGGTGGRPTVLGFEGGDTFVVRDPRAILPAPADYTQYAAEDSAWRAKYAPLLRIVDPVAWHASPEQLFNDRVFRLISAGRTAEAIELLEGWTASHPTDAARLLDLARLLAQTGRTDDAFERYRQVLALTDTPTLRLEYASALLNAGKYALAATEYSRLSSADPSNIEYRLGLARAYAWSGTRPRDAERELAWLSMRLPNDTSVESLLRSVRADFEPTSAEAFLWVTQRPKYAPYRLALVRALVREHQPELAFAHIDTLLQGGETLDLLREAAGVHAEARDSLGAARYLARAVLLAPADTALRRGYAEALAWSGDRRGAIEQYTILLQSGETASLYLERGRLYMIENDYVRAESDLLASARLAPSAEAYAMLGDIYRWRGDFKRSRAMYTLALTLKPDDPAVLASLAELDRSEKAYASSTGSSGPVPEVAGWTSFSNYAEDNSGFLYLASGLLRGFSMGRQTTLLLSGEEERVSQRRFNAGEQFVTGFTAMAGASQVVGHLLLGGRAGVASYALAGTSFVGEANAALLVRRMRFEATTSTRPVFGSLMSLSTLVQATPRGEALGVEPLLARTYGVDATVPVGRAEVSVRAERMMLSDRNSRTSFGGDVRLPIGYGFNALYSGGQLGYSGVSTRYWDPQRFTAHSLGLEYSYRQNEGLSFALRALPGVGSTEERAILGPDQSAPMPRRSTSQFAAGGDLEFRRRRWEIVASGGYGRGREGGYQSLNGTLRAHWIW
jgi:Flp pilus assembly protein TadD